MPRPVLLTVDDDPDVLRAIERDLRSQYGENYRVMRANSGSAALDVLRELKLRNDAVALLLADQRMPKMDGIAFLSQAMELYPDAKRALLTAYADTNAAINAINEVNIQYFFLKPWDPPTENLYPALDDLLDDWRASYTPAYEGVRVLGTRWSPKCYDLRDFLVVENLRARKPLQTFERHAVETSEIAFVGNRDAKVFNSPAELIAAFHAHRAATCVGSTHASLPSA